MTAKELIEQIATDSKDYWKVKAQLLELEHASRMELLNEILSNNNLTPKQ